jgi:hypothetical protein
MDSGLLAEPVIGPRDYARARWLGPGMTNYNSKSQCSLTTGRPQLRCRSVRMSRKPAF